MTAAYALKLPLADHGAASWHFEAQKTMYGGKRVAPGDTVFLFDSENEGGRGLVAHGVVLAVQATPPRPGIERQTPRVSLRVRRLGPALRPLGRTQLKPCDRWDDGRPQTELNFKLYRQATNKLVGLSDTAAAYLRGFF